MKKRKKTLTKVIKIKKCCLSCAKANSCVIGSKERMECVNKRDKDYVPNWK